MSRCSTNVVIMRRVILSSFIQAARARFAVSFSVILISQKIVISYLSCANIKEFCRTFVYRFIQLFQHIEYSKQHSEDPDKDHVLQNHVGFSFLKRSAMIRNPASA